MVLKRKLQKFKLLFLLKRNAVFLLLLANVVNSSHDQGECCLSAVFFHLLTCCHVQFLKIFHLPSFFLHKF